ncbi:helix-turn-helix domain-containing protein [Acetivibrio mesophilus]|uniref:XRE family transcriptional regulator n=1 Tax=Acetivibrio mesophilus TaxID=2487273 RepID=A0A4Q0I472_9FIRM|nr:helix-turn-helix domain-containing protein [Acetivibrio mesophilus]ODM26116.1 DNA-binding protein [Clostridium sp. Bc-iso-3]RXE59084.1 XRE family transcriptional regulator [Acetivibrio mesophilus]HHV29488.1 helix-turn-helix domain-containing protein [Clostridium sp.]
MSRLGSEIGRLRKELGITQKQLAKLVGVSEGFIADVESGKRILNEDLVKKFSRALRGEVGKLELYEAEENKPEPDANVVKVVEKPVQDIWNDALAGILMPVPVYRYKMDKSVDTKQLPIIHNKVEGFPKDKLFYLIIEDNDMSGFRIIKDDLALVYSTHDIDKDGIYFVDYKGKRTVRQIKDIGNGKLLLVSNGARLVTDTIYRKDLNVLGRLIRLEIML